MGIGNILFGAMIIVAVVIGSIFAMNYYSNQPVNTDSYGNAPTTANNNTANMVVNGTASGTNAESGLLIFVAVLLILAIIAYFAFKRY